MEDDDVCPICGGSGGDQEGGECPACDGYGDVR